MVQPTVKMAPSTFSETQVTLKDDPSQVCPEAYGDAELNVREHVREQSSPSNRGNWETTEEPQIPCGGS